jgi:hypothetical protein
MLLGSLLIIIGLPLILLRLLGKLPGDEGGKIGLKIFSLQGNTGLLLIAMGVLLLYLCFGYPNPLPPNNADVIESSPNESKIPIETPSTQTALEKATYKETPIEIFTTTPTENTEDFQDKEWINSYENNRTKLYYDFQNVINAHYGVQTLYGLSIEGCREFGQATNNYLKDCNYAMQESKKYKVSPKLEKAKKEYELGLEDNIDCASYFLAYVNKLIDDGSLSAEALNIYDSACNSDTLADNHMINVEKEVQKQTLYDY